MEPASAESENAKKGNCVKKYTLDMDKFVNFSIDTIEELDFSEWRYTELLEITRQMTLRIRSAAAVVDVVNRQMEKNETRDYVQEDVEKSSEKKRRTEDSAENKRKRARRTDETATVSAVLDVGDEQMQERMPHRADYPKDKELAWQNGEYYRQEHHNDWRKNDQKTKQRRIAAETEAVFIPKPRGPEGLWRTNLPKKASKIHEF